MIIEGTVTMSLEDFRKMEKAIEKYDKLKTDICEAVAVEGANLKVDCRKLKHILRYDVDLSIKFEEVEYDAVDTIEFEHGGKDEF